MKVQEIIRLVALLGKLQIKEDDFMNVAKIIKITERAAAATASSSESIIFLKHRH